MKIAFYDPYLDTMSGGEKYFLDAAYGLARQGHSIFFFWNPQDKQRMVDKAKQRFNMDITSYTFIPDIFSFRSSLWAKFLATWWLDSMFYLSDGSFPFLFSKKNILMFQHPVDWVKVHMLTQLKLCFVNKILCNSYFTKQHIDEVFGNKKTIVIYPGVKSVKNG